MTTQERIDAGILYDWKELPPLQNSLEGVREDTEELHFARERDSHRGFSRLQRLRSAWLWGVNPAFLEEIAAIETLEVLQLDRVTAADLRPLAQLRRLRRLIINDATKVTDLRWVETLPELDALSLGNFKRVRELDPLSALTSLKALGVEGSIWTAMRVDTLAPLSRLIGLESLFLISLRVADRSLRPLHALTRLRVLRAAAYYPDEEFRSLRQALPHLRCCWFDELDRHGSLRAAIQAAARGTSDGSPSA
ncbi:MAG: hypothetical protein ABL998_13420 [Planctomycetota bacterium]